MMKTKSSKGIPCQNLKVYFPILLCFSIFLESCSKLGTEEVEKRGRYSYLSSATSSSEGYVLNDSIRCGLWIDKIVDDLGNETKLVLTYKDDCLSKNKRTYDYEGFYNGKIFFRDITVGGEDLHYEVYMPEIYRMKYLMGIDSQRLKRNLADYEAENIYDFHCSECHSANGKFPFSSDFLSRYDFNTFKEYVIGNGENRNPRHRERLLYYDLPDIYAHFHYEYYKDAEIRLLLEYIQTFDELEMNPLQIEP